MCIQDFAARLRRALRDADQRLVKTFSFILVLIALSVPLYIVPLYPPLLLPLQDAVAGSSHALLLAMQVPAERDGLFILVTSGGPFALFIGPDCTAWKSMLLLAALMLAVPGAAPGKKAAGIIIGLPLVHAANIARIATVAAIGSAAGEEPAGLLHDVSWQLGLTALVMCVWLSWLFFCRREIFPCRRSPAPGRARGAAGKNAVARRRMKKTYSRLHKE